MKTTHLPPKTSTKQPPKTDPGPAAPKAAAPAAAQYDGINVASQKSHVLPPAGPQAPNPKLVRSAQVLLLTHEDADSAEPILLGKDQGVALVLTCNPTTGFTYTFGEAPKPTERVVSDDAPQSDPNSLSGRVFGKRSQTSHYSWTPQQLRKLGNSFEIKVFRTRHNVSSELFGYSFRLQR